MGVLVIVFYNILFILIYTFICFTCVVVTVNAPIYLMLNSSNKTLSSCVAVHTAQKTKETNSDFCFCCFHNTQLLQILTIMFEIVKTLLLSQQCIYLSLIKLIKKYLSYLHNTCMQLKGTFGGERDRA